MTNGEIYRRTMRFAVMRVLCAIIGIVIVIALPVITFILANSAGEFVSVVATGVALIVGIVLFALIARYAGYLFTAGQIAMIARGIGEGSLPADTYAAGRRAVKERFATASVYFLLYSITKAISNEITLGLGALASAVEGASKGSGLVSAIASLISAVISIMLEYLNYCSLGWVFLQKDQGSFKSTCDGAVVYFQNWKTLLKNTAKIIAISLLSFVVIGGIFFGLAYLILGSIAPLASVFANIDASITFNDSPAPSGTTHVILSVVVALLLWSGVHGAFVKPYILVSVMRRYIEAGRANPPKVDLYEKLSHMSKGFRRALSKAKTEGAAA